MRLAHARRFAEFRYATLTSWSCRRRVFGKAEHLSGKANLRFVVTSLPADTFSAGLPANRREGLENAQPTSGPRLHVVYRVTGL